VIYFIQDEATLLIKIGYTAGDPEGRRCDLQTGSAGRLVLLGAMPGEQSDERLLHQRFVNYRVAGEWFRPAPCILALLLATVAPSPPQSPRPHWHCVTAEVETAEGKTERRTFRVHADEAPDDFLLASLMERREGVKNDVDSLRADLAYINARRQAAGKDVIQMSFDFT
jgi:hypothetical protein